MIVQAFREFLRSDEAMNDAVRESGREEMRDIVRSNIWDWRVPRSVTAATAITLELASETDYGAIDSPAAILDVLVDLNIWAKDTDETSGADKAARVSTALRKMLVQYAGPLNDEVSVQTITRISGPRERPTRPTDASGNWNFRYLITFKLGVPIATPAGAN